MATYSPIIRIEDAEDAFTSCYLGLDQPGSKLQTSIANGVLCGLLLVHLEQQRQLDFVPPSHRGRRGGPNAPSTTPCRSVVVLHGREGGGCPHIAKYTL